VDNPAADARGFTLIELLVGLSLSGIIVGVLFQFISGQGRFVERQSSREEVQQNTRAALELIGSEMRTVPGGDAIVRAATDSLTIRTPRVWGVVCALPGGNALDLVLPTLVGVTYTTNLGAGVVVNLGTATSPLWSSAVSATGVSAADASCNGSALPAGVERRRLSLASLPSSGSTTPVIGNVVYLYEQVTYRTGTSGTIPGRWIQRRIGDQLGSTNQPMAGPVTDTNGLSFQYFGSGGAAVPAPITSATARASVTRVMVVVESVSRNRMNDQRETKADTIIVPLRNRI
jgi:prepilin-type N-terminal cleavage/methylation domain-containing protein